MPSKGKYVQGKQVSRWEAESDNVDIEYKNLDILQKEGTGRGSGILTGKKGKVLKGLLLLVCFFVGLILGYIIRKSIYVDHLSKTPTKLSAPGILQDYDRIFSKKVQDDLQDVVNIDDHINQWTKTVRLAATGETMKVVKYARDMWQTFPLDSLIHKDYQVTLSYWHYLYENNVTLIAPNSSVVYYAHYNDTHIHRDYLPFNSYSPAASVKGNLVYANYGTKDDFKTLEDLNVTVAGSILIIKYGKIHPSNKVKHAEDFGAIGVIFYSDPADYANNSTDVYPDTWWLPGWAVQLSHVRYSLMGDPQTPDYAAVNGVYQIQTLKDKCQGCPSIPSQPISYNDAREIIRGLAGPQVPENWNGGLGVVYNTGPGHRDGQMVNLTVSNVLASRCISNVIAVINGRYEKDKYVIIGAKMDSWTLGAVDAASGIAVLSELIRSFSFKLERDASGWRPRRTLIFALWDASKYGHIGSFEWIQEFEKDLGKGAVAYINLDTVVRGNYSFSAEASPMLFDVIREAADTVTCSDPDYPDKTVLDMWKKKFPDPQDPTLPRIHPLQGDSDHSPFMYYMGIPSVSPTYTYNTKKYKNLPNYPAYDTLEDTKEYLTNFTDKNYKLHVKVTQVIADIILRLIDSAILPLNVKNLVSLMSEGKTYLQKNGIESVFKAANIKLDFLYSQIDRFSEAADDFHSNISSLDKSKLSETDLYLFNDKLLQVPRAFIFTAGLPGHPHYRNVLIAPHPEDLYKTQVFPGVAAVLNEGLDNQNWNPMKKQLSILTLAIREAADILTDNFLVMS